MPKRFFYSVTWLLLLATTGIRAQSSLLWEISGNGLQQPSYIFGTFHILCKSDFSISDVLKSKISNSSQFYGELDMDDPAMQLELTKGLKMTGQTVGSLLGKDSSEVSDAFKKITGIPLQALNNFKPFMGLSMLMINIVNCPDKIQPESEFVKIAKANNLAIEGLESIADQLNAVDKEPLDSQILALKKTVLNYDSVKQVMAEMVSVYKQNDIDTLYRFMKEAGTDGNFEQDMLVTRNRNWIPVMQKAMAFKPAFFAVGAGHLSGTEGVINLLKKEGYVLKPVLY